MKEFAEEYIIYLRKSRADNPNESVEEVLSRHEQQLQELAVRMTGSIIKEENIYREIISGGEEVENRPAFMQVLKRMEKGNINAVLVIDTQRLSRSGIYGAGDILNAFEFTDTKIATLHKTYSLDNKFDKKFLEMEMIQSSDYLNYTKEILNRGRMLSVQNGCFIGSRPPYGYDKEKLPKGERGYKLVINEEEAEIVKMIFELFVESLGTIQLANYLNGLGLRTRDGNEWSPQIIRQTIMNETYIGEIVWGKRKMKKILEDGKIKKKVVKNDEPIFVKGKHDPIVSREIFELANHKLTNHPSAKVKRSTELKNSLAGIVYCGVCGRSMLRKAMSKKRSLVSKRVTELDEAMNIKINELLREHKAKCGYSLSKLSELTGVSKSTLGKWTLTDPKYLGYSKNFADSWFKLKEVLKIDTDEYDEIITKYEKKPATESLICPHISCKNVGGSLPRIEQAVLNALEVNLSDYKYFLDNYEEEIVKDAKINAKMLLKLDEKIEKLKKQKKNALRNYNAEDMTREEYLELKADIEEELETLEAQKINLETSEENSKLEKYKKAIPILTNCLNEYHTLTISERNELLKAIIEKIVYTKKPNNRWKRNNDFELEITLRI